MPLKPLKIKEETKTTEEAKTEEPKTEKKTAEEVFIVAKELPQQPIRQVQLDDGSIGTLISIEEALTEIINVVKKLEKAML